MKKRRSLSGSQLEIEQRISATFSIIFYEGIYEIVKNYGKEFVNEKERFLLFFTRKVNQYGDLETKARGLSYKQDGDKMKQAGLITKEWGMGKCGRGCEYCLKPCEKVIINYPNKGGKEICFTCFVFLQGIKSVGKGDKPHSENTFYNVGLIKGMEENGEVANPCSLIFYDKTKKYFDKYGNMRGREENSGKGKLNENKKKKIFEKAPVEKKLRKGGEKH